VARRDAARAILARYQAEVEYCYPGSGERLLTAQLETVGTLLPYAFPLFRLPVEASRVTLVHSAFMADALRAEIPEARVACAPHHAPVVEVAAETLAALRRRHGLAADDVVVGVFGLLTREKRIESVARAVARAAQHVPRLRLLLVGAAPEEQELARLLGGLGLGGRAVLTGRVPWEELAAHMTLPDVVVQLRYPTARETSGALLRVLAQARPTIISDLAHQADIPDAAVVRADSTDEEGEVTRAILRLATNPALRERLGRNARAFVAREHAPARTQEAYVAAIEEALAAPDPAPRDWPAHWPRPAGHP
jgi:glycosyltransferase involved in cell wall biosynthesis